MGRLTPHQWTAALRRLDRAPPMREIFNPSRFYAYSARLAYTACGSFVRHYREAQGVDELNDRDHVLLICERDHREADDVLREVDLKLLALPVRDHHPVKLDQLYALRV